MCGRYASFRQAQDLAEDFTITVVDPVVEQIGPSWNVAPTQDVRVVLEGFVDAEGARVEDEDALSGDGLAQGVQVARRLTSARWGLVPHWAKDPGVGNRMINARRETAADKPSFRHPVRRRRCLVPADAYYEWRAPQEGSGRSAKTPFAIGRPDGEPFAFAGLYSWWQVPEALSEEFAQDRSTHGGWLLTCTILTRPATGAMTDLHHRVPVILQREHQAAWLDPALTDAEQALALAAQPLGPLAWHEVSTLVNTPRNNDPSLVVAVDGGETGGD